MGTRATSPLQSPCTLDAAIRAAARCFEKYKLCFGHGTDNALDEASWLILHALGLSPATAPDYSMQLNAAQVSQCNDLLQQRIERRQPAAYLTGKAWFAGREFLCDERALVPRSPLAEFINEDFYGLLDHTTSPRILDLCTGGGCIAIACAHAIPEACVHASDLSAKALTLAAENIAMHAMEARLSLFEGSLFEPLSARYDLIISNPPYVDAGDIAAMPEEFSHEPMLGLAAGEDGLDLVRIMLAQAADYLNDGGVLVVEVGNSWQSLEAAYPKVSFEWLEFSNGGHGVFMLHKAQLMTFK